MTLMQRPLRGYIDAQVEEIRADTALRLYGALLALCQVMTFCVWVGREHIRQLSDLGNPVCWPFFETCFRYRPFTFSQVTGLLLLYGAVSVVSVLLFLFPRRCGLAYGWLLLTNAFKTLIYVQDYRLRLNQHYMLALATAAFLFVPNKRVVLRYLLVAFYVWASTLKYNAEWLSGEALYGDPLGVPRSLIPASCAYVVLLESFLVWGVLSRVRWVYWGSLLQLVLFHIVSWPVVGWFYPVLMFVLLAIFPLGRMYPHPSEPQSLLGSLLTGRQPRSTYVFLAFFSMLQLIPVAMPGDEKVTGEGRLFSLHMFDARVVCHGAITLRFKNGTTQALPIPMTGLATPRILCDPAVNFSRAVRSCAEHHNDPNFLDLDVFYSARRSHETVERPLMDVTQFCSRHLSYDVWRPNGWILKDEQR